MFQSLKVWCQMVVLECRCNENKILVVVSKYFLSYVSFPIFHTTHESCIVWSSLYATWLKMIYLYACLWCFGRELKITQKIILYLIRTTKRQKKNHKTKKTRKIFVNCRKKVFNLILSISKSLSAFITIFHQLKIKNILVLKPFFHANR